MEFAQPAARPRPSVLMTPTDPQKGFVGVFVFYLRDMQLTPIARSTRLFVHGLAAHARSAALLLVGGAYTAHVQAPDGDRRFFVPRDAAVLGAGLAASAALTVVDRRIARFAQSHTVQGSPERRHLARQVTKVNETTLTAAGLLTYGVGRLTHGTATADIGLHMTEAIVLTSVTSQLIRGPLGRSRPQVTRDSNQYDFHFMKGFSSFDFRAYPSLHSVTAFAAGSALVTEVSEPHPDALWYAARPSHPPT
jgi:hypothetical protein